MSTGWWTPDESRAVDLLAQQWPLLVPDEFVAWDPECAPAREYRRTVATDVVETLRRAGLSIVADEQAPKRLDPLTAQVVAAATELDLYLSDHDVPIVRHARGRLMAGLEALSRTPNRTEGGTS